MKRTPATFLAAVVLIALGAGISLATQRWLLAASDGHADSNRPDVEATETKSPTASVRTSLARSASMKLRVHGFGAVSLRPDATSTLNWPAELVVRRVLVSPGEHVSAGAALFAVELSPDAGLQLDLARQAVESAGVALDTARARLTMNLGTRQDVLTAEAVARDAQRRLERASASSLPSDGFLRAPSDAVIQAVRAQAGAVLAPGTPLLDLQSSAGAVAQFGIEPGSAADVAAGMGVRLHTLHESDGTGREGRVTLIGPAINPGTRMIDVIAEFLAPSDLPVGTPLDAEVEVRTVDAVTLPRQAVLPAEDGDVIFVVVGGRAARRTVKTGLRDHDRVQILGGVSVGDAVVVLGQAELEDGMSVRTEEQP